MLIQSIDLVYVVLILIGSIALSGLIKYSIKRTGEKIHLSRDTRKSANWVIDLILYSLATIASLYVLGFDAGALFAGVGIFALAIGFAAQQLLSNLIAGFIIIIEKPFKIGDLILFDGKKGWVDGIGLRSTRIITYDGNMIVAPNTNLVNSVVLNSTIGVKEEVVSVSLLLKDGSDIKTTIEKIKKIPESMPECIVDKKHIIEAFITPVEKLGVQRYSIEFLFWVKDSKTEKKVVSDFTQKAKKILES